MANCESPKCGFVHFSSFKVYAGVQSGTVMGSTTSEGLNCGRRIMTSGPLSILGESMLGAFQGVVGALFLADSLGNFPSRVADGYGLAPGLD
jgi:hypothetical protein